MNKQDILAYAKSVGFDVVGVSKPHPERWPKYAEWIESGYHGEMHYLANRCSERKNPAFVLKQPPGSIIVLAKNYHTIDSRGSLGDTRKAIVSRYAWGDDYHQAVAEAAQQVCHAITERTGGSHTSRWCVDTAPILERDYAAQTGIGWVGKHTNLLSREWGNWLFLAAVVTTLPLEPDDPAPPHCGTCTRCLDICPTNAFPAPYVLDARRCISYLTIELKGPIPLELRPGIGRRVFGCDDCLAVCPWNRFAKQSNEIRFQPRRNLDNIDLITLMQLTDEEFREWFRDSPIKRTKRRGLLRNVAVALGNAGDKKAVPVLIEALQDHEPLIRGHSAWALGVLGGQESRNALQTRLAGDDDSYVRNEIEMALAMPL